MLRALAQPLDKTQAAAASDTQSFGLALGLNGEDARFLLALFTLFPLLAEHFGRHFSSVYFPIYLLGA